MKRSTSLLLPALLLAACGGEDPSAPPIGQDGQPIKNGRSISTSEPFVQKARGAVNLFNCTGVIVGRRAVLTAAHCNPRVGNPVEFYDDSTPTGFRRNIVSVAMRTGVDPSRSDYTDIDGKFADIAVLTLDGDIPWYADIIELPDGYPGSDVWAGQVGRGRHNGGSNPTSTLQEIWTKTRSGNVDNGSILTQDEQTNPGDSGGPLYMFNANTSRYEAHGVLYGYVYDWGWRNKYTSIWHHIDFVMSQAGFGWTRPWRNDRFINGDFLRLEVLGDKSSDHCVLKCDKDSECNAVSYRKPGSTAYCYMFRSVSGYVTWSGFRSTPVN